MNQSTDGWATQFNGELARVPEVDTSSLALARGLLVDHLELCESPIEEAMFCALFIVSITDRQRRWNVIVQDHDSRRHYGCLSADRTLVIEPQWRFQQWRVDFRLGVQRSEASEADETVALVECDGHDFHERTKEQARRDRYRDRQLQQEGFRVLRFTGSEIWAYPLACAAEATLQAAGIVCG